MDGILVGKSYARINNSDAIAFKTTSGENKMKENYLSRFYLLFNSTVIFYEYVDLINTGTAIPNISPKLITELKSPLPNFPEEK